jgi:hypothetical protein
MSATNTGQSSPRVPRTGTGATSGTARRVHSARRHRRVVAVLALAVLVSAVPAPATADAPIRDSTTNLEVGCDLVSEDGALTFLVSNRATDGGAMLTWFAPGTDPEHDEPTLAGEGPATWDGGSFAGELTLNGSDDETVQASYEGSVTPIGAGTTERVVQRRGNVRMDESFTSQDAVVHGSLTIDGVGSFDLADCAGSSFHIERFITWPRTSLDVLPEAFRADCVVTDGGGDDAGSLVLEGDDHGVMAFLVLGDEEDPSSFGVGFLEGERDVLTGHLELLDAEWEEVGTAAVELRSTVVGRRTTRHRWQNGGSRTRSVDVRLDGAIIGDDVAAQVVACAGQRDSGMERLAAPRGPSHNGPTFANDVPDGAVLVAPGTRQVTSTRTTAPAVEAPMSCWPDPEPFAGHTLWYRIEGTGGDVTVDTAGSAFNTVVAVYADAGGALDELDCVDDVLPATRQAVLTLPTVAGETYLVQIGGFGGQFGQLKLTVR